MNFPDIRVKFGELYFRVEENLGLLFGPARGEILDLTRIGKSAKPCLYRREFAPKAAGRWARVNFD